MQDADLSSRTESRRRLLELLRKRSLSFGDVRLSSGKASQYYVDGKMVELMPEGAHLIGELLFEELESVDFDAVGGLAVGAVPMVTSFVISCHHHARDVEGFFVRVEPKSHGTKKRIEGKLESGDRVVIVDDVVTSGASIAAAIEAVEERGAKVVQLLAIVDRDSGAAERFRQEGYKYRWIFSKQELLEDVDAVQRAANT